jgi:hypothetical protein
VGGNVHCSCKCQGDDEALWQLIQGVKTGVPRKWHVSLVPWSKSLFWVSAKSALDPRPALHSKSAWVSSWTDLLVLH